MQPSERQVHITWHTTPPSPAQLTAWRWLWTRLDRVDPGPETRQPQDPREPGEPGAATVATVGSGHNLLSELATNDSRFTPHSK